jgi:hypothetical protein
MKTSAYKVRNSGKQIETDKARRADVLKISFTIAENQIAKSGDKVYYASNRQQEQCFRRQENN